MCFAVALAAEITSELSVPLQGGSSTVCKISIRMLFAAVSYLDAFYKICHCRKFLNKTDLSNMCLCFAALNAKNS